MADYFTQPFNQLNAQGACSGGRRVYRRCKKAPMQVVLAYRNFAADRAISHIGLGVTALNSAPWIPTIDRPQFRRTVRHMHLLLQPSYTESFNVVTADGVAEGVASVVSEAIEWAPDSWKAPVDDAHAMAAVGRKLLSSRRAPRQGLSALRRHNRRAIEMWRGYLAA